MKITLALVGLALVVGACTQAGASLGPTPTAAAATSSGGPPAASMSAMASTPATMQDSGGPAITAPPNSTAVTVLDFKILPATLTVRSTFSLFVTNQGPTVHNVTIRDSAGKLLMATPDLRPGDTAVLAGTLAPGTYVTFCSLPGHESLGTKGTLTVTA